MLEDDIDELIRLRISYMIDDFGSVSEAEKEGMEKQLPDYFARKLGTELIAFVARDNGKIVSVAYLHIIEMPEIRDSAVSISRPRMTATLSMRRWDLRRSRIEIGI